MSEVNLIGGFYQAKSLPFSAQDAVNWLPVPSKAEGSRSPIKLRGLPGLVPFVTANPPPTSGTWAFFTRTQAGGDTFFTSTQSPESFSFPGANIIPSSNETDRCITIGQNIVCSTLGASFIRASSPSGPYLTSSGANGSIPGTALARSGGRFIAPSNNDVCQYSSDNGATWTSVPFSGFFETRGIGALDNGTLVAFGLIFPTSRISTDNGTSWALAGAIQENTQVIYGVVGNADTFLIVYTAGAGVLKCAKGNASASVWQPSVVIATTPPAPDSEGYVARGEGNLVLVATNDGRIYRSLDFGDTWSPSIASGLQVIRGLEYGGGYFVAIGEVGSSQCAAVYSQDNGVTWQQSTVSEPPAATTIVSLAYFEP